MTDVCDIFVTPEEVKRITGYKRPHEQKKWLDANGWKFELDSAGRPIIHREVMNKRFGVTNKNYIDQQPSIRTWKPDLTKVN